MKAAAYDAIGSLPRRCPSLFSGEIAMVRDFFKALDSESNDLVRFSIQSCLMIISTAFRRVPSDDDDDGPAIKLELETILLESAAKVLIRSSAFDILPRALLT